MIPARIVSTASLLPGPPRTTRELAETLGGRDASDIERKTGIAARHWITPGTPPSELGAQVLRVALERAGMKPADLKRVIFVSSTGGEELIPATANSVCLRLGVEASCDAFDLNNACMGFLSALDVAFRSAATGLAPVAVVVVETLSPFLSPQSPRPYLVLADAAAAVIVGPGRAGEGVLATHLGSRPSQRGNVTLAHPGLTHQRELIAFAASQDELTRVSNEALGESVARVLHESGCTLDDVAWVVPHQPNGRMLERITAHLGVVSEKVVKVVHEVGSVGAASVAVGLDRLFQERDVRAGDRILFAGVGAGMAYGATLFRVAP